MIVVFTKQTQPSAIQEISALVSNHGFDCQVVGRRRGLQVLSIQGPASLLPLIEATGLASAVHSFEGSWGLVARQMKPEGTTVKIGKAKIGGPEFAVIAGPCSVESEDQLLKGRPCGQGGWSPGSTWWGFQTTDLALFFPRVRARRPALSWCRASGNWSADYHRSDGG